MQVAQGTSTQAVVHTVLHNKQVLEASGKSGKVAHLLDRPAQHAARQFTTFSTLLGNSSNCNSHGKLLEVF